MKATVERILDETARDTRSGIKRIAWGDAEYPAQLRSVPDAPPFLYMRGEIAIEDALAVAIVGSRRATPYGLDMAERLAGELATRGVTVVSGLARGIDSAAHRGALGAGGRTIAVLGSGADVIYPPENRRLAEEITERGAVVSQFELGTRPLAFHFPARNRVIAALALGVVVVEAAERSGSLITAGLAAELGREVMAVPGRVTSAESRGTHGLIQDGATLVQGWEDVIAQLPTRWQACVRSGVAAGPTSVTRAGALDEGGPAPATMDGAERVLDVLGGDAATMDEVIQLAGLAPGQASALLLRLELDGRVRQLEGKRFVRVGGS